MHQQVTTTGYAQLKNEMELSCLCRCFSYFLFETQAHHLDVCIILTDFMTLNPCHFSAYCHPMSVESHAHRIMWGTHSEILSMALCFQRPVYVALQKTENEHFYWAKYSASVVTADVTYPTKQQVVLFQVKSSTFKLFINIHHNHSNFR